MTQQPASTDDTNAIAVVHIPDDWAVPSSNQLSDRINHGPPTTKLEDENGKFLRRNPGTGVAAQQDAGQEADIIIPPSVPEQHKNVSLSVSATSSGRHNSSHKIFTMVGGNDVQVHDNNINNAPPSNSNVHVVEGSVAYQQNHEINPGDNDGGEVITTTKTGAGLPSTSTTASTTNSTLADDAGSSSNQDTNSTTMDIVVNNTNDASQLSTGGGSLATLTKSVSGRRTFPTKLFDILARDDLSHIISWLPHGRSWKVHDQDEFEAKVMPVYFQQTKFASFARQVTGWGFKRITAGGPDRNSYFHELFLRDEPRLHITMKRPVKKRQVEMMPGGSEPDFYSLAALPGGGVAMHHHHAAVAAATQQHHAGMAAAAHHRSAVQAHSSPYGNTAGTHPAQQHLNLYAAAAAASQPSAAHHLGLTTTTRGAAALAGAAAYGNELLGAASLADPYGCMGMQLVHAPSAAASAAAYAPHVSAPSAAYGGLGAAAAGLLNTAAAQVGADGRLQLLDNNISVNVNSHHHSPHQAAAYANMLSQAGLSASQMGAHLAASAAFAPPAAVASSSSAAADQHHSYHAQGAASGMQRFVNPQQQQQQQQHPPPS